MRGSRVILLAALTALVAGGSAAGGGLLCMLAGRDVNFGEIKTVSQDGTCQVSGETGNELVLGKQTAIIRIQRIKAEDLKPGDQFVALRGRPSRCVTVYSDLKDLIALYTSMGHGTTRKPEGKQAAR